MSVLPTHSPARRRILTPYVMIWLAIASFALAYLALLGLRPHMFAEAKKDTPNIEQKITQVKRDVERGLADLEPIRRTVGEVKMDVANLKVAAEQSEERDRMIMEKVTALETSAIKGPQAAPATKTSKQIPPAAASVPPTPKQNPKKSTAVSQSGTGPKVINNAQASGARSIETGSIERKNKAAAPKTPVGVLVATGSSIDALRLNWTILTDRHGQTIRNLRPRYVIKGSGAARSYGLVVGPVASTAKAQNLCKELTAKGQTCTVSKFQGNAL
jgi:hypothetical protein